MTRLRIASYNIEWMNNLFVPGQAKLRGTKGKGMGRNPDDPRRVAERIAAVILELDADILGVQEGPAHLKQMVFFVKHFLNDAYEVHGMPSGSQSIYTLVRKTLSLEVTQVHASDKLYAYLKRPVIFQPWGQFNSTKGYSMARPPVLLQLRKKGQLEVVEIVVVHTKSQFTQALTAKKFEKREPTAMKEAILARQKLSADIAAYRRHVTHVILARKAAGVVLIGDINDGFTRNTFETEFLMQSLVDQLRGSFMRQNALLEHAMTQKQLSESTAYTVEFKSSEQSNKKVRELIDHIFMTPRLRQAGLWLRFKSGSARIGHELSARHTDNNGRKADDRPSDHVPVWADFEY